MKRILCLVLLIFAFASVITAQITFQTQQKLDSIALASIKKGIPGIQVLVKDKKNEHNFIYGFQDTDKSYPINDSTNWRIGSITKLFTAVVILQLEAEGKLTLNEPVSKYMDNIPLGDSIRLLNLLNHTSGLYNYTNDKKFRKARDKGVSISSCVEYGLRHESDFNPNEKFKYCNTGFAMLGLIIEKVTHKSVRENFEKRIFESCGLSSAVYCENGQVPSNTAHGYMQQGKKLKDYTFLDHAWANTAGAILCSVTDLLKFSTSLFQGKLLDSLQLSKMITPTYRGEIPGADAMGVGCFLALDRTGEVDYIFFMEEIRLAILAYCFIFQKRS